jgi:hypothetical protein
MVGAAVDALAAVPRQSPGRILARESSAATSFRRRLAQESCGTVAITPTQRSQRCRDQHGVIDRRLLAFFEIAAQPAGSDARVAVRFPRGDQDRQFERFVQRDPADLARGRLGDQQVAALKCPTKDRPWMPLRGQIGLPPLRGRTAIRD